jgi:hypothetical protein
MAKMGDGRSAELSPLIPSGGGVYKYHLLPQSCTNLQAGFQALWDRRQRTIRANAAPHICAGEF